MADISITITADPSQAVQGLEQVDQAAKAVAESAKKVQSATDAASTDAINSVSTVSREMAQTISQTGSALDTVSGGIKAATSEAGKVAGAFGKSIPVIGQIGSAISQAITGPIGAVSAVVGVVIAGIRHMIQQVQDELELMQRRAEGRTNNAYDALMQGRKDYADQLQVLAQVREINRYAEQNKLTTDQLAQFRQLAGQIGIAERDVGDRGIREGKLSAAARSLRQQRERYAAEEYRNYTTSFDVQLLDAVMKSGLSTDTRNKLGSMNTAERVRTITQAAKLGQGADLGEYKAWQDLYGMVKQYGDVVSSYGRDALLGRDQATLNGMIADNFKTAAEKSAKASASGSASPAPVGSWAWQQEQDKLMQKTLDEEKARQDRGEKLLSGLDRQIRFQELIAEGKEKEAFILRNRLQLEDTVGTLTAAQIAAVEERASRLYDLQHPVAPDLAPEAASAPARTRARTQQQYTPRLDRLQQIGANLRSPAVSPEKLVMDKQLTTQEQIYALLQFNFSASRQIGGLMFP